MARTLVLTNIAELMSLRGVRRKQGRRITQQDLGLIKKAALVVAEGRVQWVGPEKKLPLQWQGLPTVDCGGRFLFPGFVDCHTHLVFAGDRKGEFEQRNQGVSYQDIAAKGGGILSTMRATRRASEEELLGLAQARVQNHLSQGVTTLEVKSGYGLTEASELKMLRVARRLKGPRVYTTFLGAHAIPQNSGGEVPYLESLKKTLLKVKNQGLADRVDVFVEKGYFSVKSSREYLRWAQQQGFDLTVHADQLSATGATRMAVDLQARSADHVICLSKKDKKRLAESNTVAVLLPTADFYLKADYPDARGLLDQGACVALASDFNPGSSPTQNLGFVGLLARSRMAMSLPEVFAALTYGGAKALGIEDQVGVLQPGYQADFFLSDWSWKNFFYDLSPPPIWKTFVAGKPKFKV